MPDPVYIGVGRFRGQWDANANDLFQTDGTTSVESGTALSDGDWANTMDAYVGYSAGEGPKVGDYLKVKTAGTTSINGEADWRVGDWCVYTTGSVWKKLSTADTIASVVVGDTNITALSDALLTGSHSRWEQQVLFVSGNCPTASFTGSNSFTYQYATNASTGYSALRLTGNLLVDGQIQAKQINTIFHSRSVIYESGSTRFGDSTYDLHEFSGTLRVNSSLSGTSEWTGSVEFDGDLSGAASHQITFPIVSASTKVTTNALHGIGESDYKITLGTSAMALSGAASSVWAVPVLSASTKVVTAQIGAVGDAHALAFTDGVISGAASTKLHMPVVSASTKVVTAQIGAIGDAHALAFTDGVVSGAASTTLHMPVVSASTKVVTAQLGPVGDAHLLVLTDGLVSGAASSKLQIPAITASYGITVPQVGPAGDEDLLALASGVLTVNGAVSSSGFYATQIGVSGDDDLLGLSSGVLTVLGAVSSSGLYTAQIGLSGDDDLLALGSGVLTVNGALSGAHVSGTTCGMIAISASKGVYTPQIGVNADDDLLALASGVLTVNGALSASTKVVTAQIGASGDAHALAFTDGVVSGAASTKLQMPAISASTGIFTSQVKGDADTRMVFSDDQITFQAGGVGFVDFLESSQDSITFNGGVTDIDFVVHGNSLPKTLFISGSDGIAHLSQGLRVHGGTVGIGIADPDSYVAEKRNLVVGATAGNTGMTLVSAPTGIATIQFRGNTTVNDKEGWIDYSQNTEKMRFGTAGLNTQMTIDSAGNVGIGVNPEGKLHVYTGDASIAPSALADELVVEGAGSTGISILTPNDQVGRLYFGDSDNAARAYVLYDHSVDMMKFSIASGNKLVIDNSGQVGIGVEDPDSKLEVAGKIHISGEQGSAPSAPSDGDGGFLYAKADGKIYWRSNELTETDLTTGGGGGGSIDGGGASTRIAFWSDADTLSSDANFTWDGSDVLAMSGTLLLTSNTTTDHRVSGSLLLKTDSTSEPGSNDTGFSVRGDGAGSVGRGIMTVDNNNNGLLILSASTGKTMFRAGTSTETAPHADYNIDRARKFILSGSTFIGSSGQTQTNVDTHDVWGHFYCTSGSIRIMSGATGRQDDFYGINLPNHSDKLGSIRANAFPTYSSVRWKYNVEAINDPLTRVNQLRGVFFDWKETGKSDMGFIAEEVGEVLPRIVRYEDDGVHAESLDYGKIIPLCVEAIKALSAKNTVLEEEIRALKKKI